MLQSSSFLYRWELGPNAAPIKETTKEGVLVRLNGDEVAARLSYTLWSSMPDDALFRAADAGQLGTLAGVEAEARRMLKDPEGPEPLPGVQRGARQGYGRRELGLRGPAGQPTETSVRPSSPAPAGPGASGGPETGGAAPTAAASALAPAAMARLTQEQYTNTVRDLLGASLKVPLVDADTSSEGFKSVGARQATISSRAVDLYDQAAREITTQAFGATNAGRAALLPCKPSGPSDRACARQFFVGFGRRAWRRPLTDAEADLFADLTVTAAGKLGDFWEGLALATAGLLQSPKFLFRIELGEPDPADVRRWRYTSWEMASRLSYYLWNSTPDDLLLGAAARGDLTTAAGVAVQAMRLGTSPRATAGLSRLFEELLDLDRLAELGKDTKTFPTFTPALAESMGEETRRFVADGIFKQKLGLAALLDLPTTFVDGRLAALYKLPAPAGDDFQPVALAGDGLRRGLLTQAWFLALHATLASSSPTQRGLFVQTRLLCHAVPPPPANVNPVLPADDGRPSTRRQKLEAHRKDPACAGCHELMDPIGLAFETFDGIGAQRDKENGLPIDPSGTLEGKAFSGVAGLLGLLKAHTALGPCFARQAFRHATGQGAGPAEEAYVQTAGRDATDATRSALAGLLTLVTSDGFRYAEVRR